MADIRDTAKQNAQIRSYVSERRIIDAKTSAIENRINGNFGGTFTFIERMQKSYSDISNFKMRIKSANSIGNLEAKLRHLQKKFTEMEQDLVRLLLVSGTTRTTLNSLIRFKFLHEEWSDRPFSGKLPRYRLLAGIIAGLANNKNIKISLPTLEDQLDGNISFHVEIKKFNKKIPVIVVSALNSEEPFSWYHKYGGRPPFSLPSFSKAISVEDLRTLETRYNSTASYTFAHSNRLDVPILLFVNPNVVVCNKNEIGLRQD